jgi:hypothetical protein
MTLASVLYSLIPSDKKTEIPPPTRLEMDGYPKNVGLATFSGRQSQT